MRALNFLLTLVLLSAPAFAQAEEKKATPLQIGGEFRLRSETLLDAASFVPSRQATADDSFVLMRVRVHGEAKPADQVRLFIQPQFSRTFAQEESSVANTTNVDDLDLHQGYVDFLDLAGGLLSLRLGRQELAFGKERLVGTFGWSNVGRSFDAVKLKGAWEKFWLDGFFSWIQRAGGNQYFGGSYGHWDIVEAVDYEPSFFVLRDNDGGLGGGALTLYTVGNRLTGTLGDHWDFDTEGA
ncbi:MAG: alginate export family protein, partial [Deltaproteobacteria bacterium]|nr:alginate export family protein [Deltaproteobacteria bacterium]